MNETVRLPHPRTEVRCAECGYGAVVVRPPARCPMCGERRWLVSARVPVAR